MSTIAKLNAAADKAAKARTPSVVYPHNGGLNNPDWKFKRGCDIGRTQYSQVGDQVVRQRGFVLVDRVLPVKRFGGV